MEDTSNRIYLASVFAPPPDVSTYPSGPQLFHHTVRVRQTERLGVRLLAQERTQP